MLCVFILDKVSIITLKSFNENYFILQQNLLSKMFVQEACNYNFKLTYFRKLSFSSFIRSASFALYFINRSMSCLFSSWNNKEILLYYYFLMIVAFCIHTNYYNVLIKNLIV